MKQKKVAFLPSLLSLRQNSEVMKFDPFMLEAVLGERSVIDLPALSISSRKEALKFIFTYGFDLSDYKDSEFLWRCHRLAVEILEEEILEMGEEVPAEVRNREDVKDLANLLIIASQKDRSGNQKYACALLRIIHIIVHLDNDLFTSFTDDIQYQILRPIQEHITKGEGDTTYLGNNQEIELIDFSIKSFKQTRSGVVKLLAKKNAVAMTLLDRVGLRFVTKNVYDIFRVVKYLSDNHLISFAQTISGQSKNMICPLHIFLEAAESVVKKDTPEDIEVFSNALNKRLSEWYNEGNSLGTHNEFSAKEFKFLKFISRRFLKIDRGPQKEPLNFFYPFEIQIIDQETFENNVKGTASHLSYKERQRRAARRRVLGFSNPSEGTDEEGID